MGLIIKRAVSAPSFRSLFLVAGCGDLWPTSYVRLKIEIKAVVATKTCKCARPKLAA